MCADWASEDEVVEDRRRGGEEEEEKENGESVKGRWIYLRYLIFLRVVSTGYTKEPLPPPRVGKEITFN